MARIPHPTFDSDDSVLQGYLHELQRDSLPVIALLFVTIASIGFLWVFDGKEQVHKWDVFSAFACLLALGTWVWKDRYPFGTWLVTGGACALIYLAQVLSGRDEVLILLVLPCILVTSYLGTRSGLLFGLALSALLISATWLERSQLLQPSAQLTLFAIWSGIGLLWAALRPLRAVTSESWFHYSASRSLLEESRDRQQELNQAYRDLRDAYKEMGRLNQVLVATQRLADEARQAKEVFVANVSHELRTPLNMIIGFSSMMTRTPLTYRRKLPADLLVDISAIQRNAEHLSRLVDDVLDLSKADSGLMNLSLNYVAVAPLIEEAAQSVHALFDSKRLFFRTEIEADLPEVLCDSTRIRQVILNLLSNAGRIVERGGVWIRAYVVNREVVVNIEDTGPGIAEAELGLLFEPFRQLEMPTRPEKGGTGLGLAISRKLVELHGGRMWVESSPGAGASFYFSLPLLVPAATVGTPGRWLSTEFPHHDRSQMHSRELPTIDKRILFVDPEGSLYSLALHYMRDHVELALAKNAAEVVADLTRASTQLLVLNQTQDSLFAPLRATIQALPFHVPLITCAAPGMLTVASHLGVQAYLVKPISREALLAAVDDVPPPVQTILVVDDEPEVIQLFSRMLGSHTETFTILRADNGLRALELIRTCHPDLVLLDLAIPGLTGFEVLTALKIDPELAETRVIVTSAQDPAGEPVVSDQLSVFRSSGFSGKELIEVIGALAETLSPFLKPGNPAPPGTPLG